MCNLLNGKVFCGFSVGGGILWFILFDVVYSDGIWYIVSFVFCLDFFVVFLFDLVFVYIIVVFVIFCIFLCVLYFNFF